MSSRAMTTPAAIGVRRRLKLLMFVMVLFLSWAGYTLFDQYGQMHFRSTQLRAMDNKLTDAESKSENLKQQIARLNDAEYIGQIARKEQNMGLPGEKPIVIEKSAP
jgi:cell division protein DivIC